MPDCAPDYLATPHQVAADQRAAVADAVRELGPNATPEQISDRAVLAVNVVRRRLAELSPAEG